jgi:hypothetical protein
MQKDFDFYANDMPVKKGLLLLDLPGSNQSH